MTMADVQTPIKQQTKILIENNIFTSLLNHMGERIEKLANDDKRNIPVFPKYGDEPELFQEIRERHEAYALYCCIDRVGVGWHTYISIHNIEEYADEHMNFKVVMDWKPKNHEGAEVEPMKCFLRKNEDGKRVSYDILGCAMKLLARQIDYKDKKPAHIQTAELNSDCNELRIHMEKTYQTTFKNGNRPLLLKVNTSTKLNDFQADLSIREDNYSTYAKMHLYTYLHLNGDRYRVHELKKGIERIMENN